MPLDLEAKHDDSMQLEREQLEQEQLEQERATAQQGGWLLEGAGSAFLRKFTMACALAKQTEADMTCEQYDALRSDHLVLGATEPHAVMSSLSGTFPEFSWSDRDGYDVFVSPS